MLDTLGGGSVFSVFDLLSGFTQLTIQPDTIPLTAFCTPNGLTTPSCPIPGVGLGGLAPSPDTAPSAGLGGLTPPPDTPVLGGLPLTKDDFRTHRAPMPPRHMTAQPNRPRATPLEAPCTAYAIDANDAAPTTTHTKPNRDFGR